MEFICYPKCSTCKKAESWLEGQGFSFGVRNIKEQNPTAEELRDWYQKSGLGLRKFFNTSGMLYREMGLKEKLETMTEEEMLKLLATDGMLVKRPIVVAEDVVLVGFQEKRWQEVLLSKQEG